MSDEEPEPIEIPKGDDDGRELGTFGKIKVAQRIRDNSQSRREERQNQPPPPQYPPPQQYPPPAQPIQYPPGQYPPQGQYPEQIVVQPQPTMVQPQPGVVTAQPVGFAQGAWVRPDLCGLACDPTTWYASCCPCCARGEQAELMGESYLSAFLIRWCFFCASTCTLHGERNRLRTRYNIPATDGFCTVYWCESCVVSQQLHQLRTVPIKPLY
ncbi:Oidioi.mRNA.OKI2018_I69.chr2.g4800.t1.cds [Oikopleura dioica]|uniref:Oidioi.mRNA.OKI2018_I69.chr2.g4800.t1.cds n=1 Tax=Oikopleura dioica TaxID=34765 RepID=A0ABN7T1T5_OIKDI|nr:Oidioi.mRNA.OKI2018_I69.chr2.g4800.t1.cds [Oikopleura dioica]